MYLLLLPPTILTYLLIYLLTHLFTYSVEHSPSWESNRFSASQEIPRIFFEPERSLPQFTCVRHLSLSWASSIQSISPHHTSWRAILIVSSHLRLCIPSGLFPSDFPQKSAVCTSPIRTTCPTHLTLLDFITRTILGEEYRSLSSSLCSFLHSPVTSSFFGRRH